MEIEKHLEKIEDILIKGFCLKNEQTETSNETEKQPLLSLVEKDGVKYVRLCVGSYDVVIDMRDAPTLMNWDEANAYCKNKGMKLPEIDLLMLIYALRKDINPFLVENSGEAFKEDWYLSGSEYTRNLARLVYFYNGYANRYTEYHGTLFGLSQSIHHFAHSAYHFT